MHQIHTPTASHYVDMLALDLGLVPEEVKAKGCRHTYERFLDFRENRWASTKK